MASKFALIHLSALVEDPKNIRRNYSGIDELAYTIHTHGLLQNLIVVPIGKDRYMVKDGNRRRRAFIHLVDRKLRDFNEPVPCNILESDGNLEQIIAEVQKQEAPIWHLGYRFNEFREMGMKQEDISAHIGKSHGFISRAQQIATNLHPATVDRLDKLPLNTLSNEQIFSLSRHIHPVTKEPMKDEQLARIETFLEVKKRIRKPMGKAKGKDLTIRFSKLKTKMKIPGHAVAYVNAIVDYLDGVTNTLRF